MSFSAVFVLVCVCVCVLVRTHISEKHIQKKAS